MAAKSAMLHRLIEVSCSGDCEITSFMLACMINMPWCLPNLKQFPSAVWSVVDALCIRVAPRNALLQTVLPVVLSNNTRDNICIVMCLGTLAEGTAYRKAIDALLHCVEMRDEVVTATGTATPRCSCLVVILARILHEDYECEEVAFGLVDMVASGNRYWASVVLEWATTGGCARNVSRFLYFGRIVPTGSSSRSCVFCHRISSTVHGSSRISDENFRIWLLEVQYNNLGSLSNML